MTTSFDEQSAAPEPEKEAAVAATAETGDTAPAANSDTPDVSLAGEAMNLLSEHKGKLAIGVAATLGMMVYYGWRENRLAKTDPEEYARLQRIKAIVRQSGDQPRSKTARKTKAARQAEAQADAAAANAPVQADARPDID